MFRQKQRKKEERRASGTEEMLAEFVLSGFHEANEAGGSAICSEQGGKFTVESWEETHQTSTIRKWVVVATGTAQATVKTRPKVPGQPWPCLSALLPLLLVVPPQD